MHIRTHCSLVLYLHSLKHIDSLTNLETFPLSNSQRQHLVRLTIESKALTYSKENNLKERMLDNCLFANADQLGQFV